MEYRAFGKTGWKVSRLSLGGGPLGGFYGPLSETEAVDTVRTALDLGINFIDTAPYYGITRSESVLGVALKGIDRSRYYLSTKVGRYHDQEFDFSAARVTKTLDESLQRLGLEYADLIIVHDIEFGDMQRVVDETLPALRKARDKGKLRKIGVSGYPLKIYRFVLDRTELDAIISYCHYTLADTTLSGLIPYLKQKGIGLINASPLSMGLLTQPGPPAWHPAPKALKEAARAAADFCAKNGATLERVALQFAAANSDIGTTLVGARLANEIRENVANIEQKPDPTILAEVQKILAPVKDTVWPSGKPENN